jgi:hypothetical protein
MVKVTVFEPRVEKVFQPGCYWHGGRTSPTAQNVAYSVRDEIGRLASANQLDSSHICIVLPGFGQARMTTTIS